MLTEVYRLQAVGLKFCFFCFLFVLQFLWALHSLILDKLNWILINYEHLISSTLRLLILLTPVDAVRLLSFSQEVVESGKKVLFVKNIKLWSVALGFIFPNFVEQNIC